MSKEQDNGARGNTLSVSCGDSSPRGGAKEPPPRGEVAAEPTERALRIRTAPELLDHAKRLRQEMTRQERRLWYDFLRTHPMKWYKQRPYCGYVLDFFCQQIMLAVELDGGQHYEEAGKSYDEERAENLKKNGVTVLRFSNLDIEKNFSGVCQSINIEINCHQNKQPMEKL